MKSKQNMSIDVLTIFPKMFPAILGESIIKRAQKNNKVKINIHNLRDFTSNKHRKIDDRPFGGGPGMVFRPEPIFNAVEYIMGKKLKFENRKLKIKPKAPEFKNTRVVLLSPQGKRLNQSIANKFSKFGHIILICGHYEGIDERVREYLVTDEISIGDYILTGGELPALVFIDAITRLIPGVLGENKSLHFESFSDKLLEYPQYTRPANFFGLKVPDVLTSGDHNKIIQWRKKQALKITKKKRPDLLSK